MQPNIAAAVAEAYSDLIVGIKTAHYWTRLPWDAAHPPWASVERAVEAGELCRMPVMVDFWPRPPERPYPDLILKKLRPGRHPHPRLRPAVPHRRRPGQGVRSPVAGAQAGRDLRPGPRRRQLLVPERGPGLQRRLRARFDQHRLPHGQRHRAGVEHADDHVEVPCMGMPLPEVIFRSTVTPAAEIGRPELGTLSHRREADVAVLKHLAGDFGYVDCGKAS